MVADAPYVVVVGGANVDVQGRSHGPIVAGDSNPGTAVRTPGGVGRNVAHGVASLGVDTRLITALGDDEDGRWLHAVTSAAGVDLSDVVWSALPSARYLAVLDEDGELVAAVNDMAVVDDLDAAAIAERAGVIDRADAVVVDANLARPTLEAVAEHARTLFVDPVSVAKSTRVDGLLDRVHTIKPNRAELAALTGHDVTDEAAVRAAAAALVERGVRRVVVSLGQDGVLVAEPGRVVALPLDEGTVAGTSAVASVTGAGDAMLAGLVVGHLRHAGSDEAVRFAMACAAEAVRSQGAVPGQGAGTG
ncbi:MAG: carbohydrate kinase family protein [Actinomycetota bacterium]